MLRKLIFGLSITLIALFSLLELRNLISASSHDKAIAFGYFAALSYSTVFGFLLRRMVSNFFVRLNKVGSFVGLGLFGAFVVETSIWGAQTVLRTTGAAISSNLFIDLVMTLPFYAALAFLFARIAAKNRLPWTTVALLGGIYEVFADGIVGNLFKGDLLGILISPLLLPIFVVVYAPIILVPYLVIFEPGTGLYKTNFEVSFLKPALSVLVLPVSITAGVVLERFLT